MRIARALVLCLLPSLASAQPVQILHAFGLSPAAPSGALLEAPDGSFYGTAATGICRRAPDGQVTLVARVDGAVDALRRGSDGALYGVTKYGGPNAVGIVVESLGVPPVPIVVERATYASPGGVTWASGGNALASPLP